MAYAPTVGRLECGVFPNDPKGFWEQGGYGILSVFKTDWNTFGGIIIMFTTIPHFRNLVGLTTGSPSSLHENVLHFLVVLCYEASKTKVCTQRFCLKWHKM